MLRDIDDQPEARWQALDQLDAWLRAPMLVLSFVWLFLVVYELVGSSRLLEIFGTVIWIIFIAEFGLRLALAPDRSRFIRTNWLTMIALLVPALRLFRALRVLRAARALRGMRVVRIVGTANRGMNALRATLRRRRLGYVVALTTTVALLGAGGMLAPLRDARAVRLRGIPRFLSGHAVPEAGGWTHGSGPGTRPASTPHDEHGTH